MLRAVGHHQGDSIAVANTQPVQACGSPGHLLTKLAVSQLLTEKLHSR